MTLHWAAEYTARDTPLTWELGAQGPSAFDCWGFVRHVWREHFGIDVPIIECDKENPRAYAQRFMQHDERTNWIKVDVPEDGDAVLLSQGVRPTHVGVYAEVDGGRVLHCLKGMGVVSQGLGSLKMNCWNVLGFYRHRSKVYK